jgi:hypothetical protein
MAHGSIVDLPEFYSYHRIKGEDVHFRQSVGSWTASGATLRVDFDDVRYFDYNSLRIVPLNSSDVEITCNSIPLLESDVFNSFIFQTWLKSVNDFVVEIEVNVGSFSQSVRALPVGNNNWTIARGFSADTPETFSAEDVSVVLRFKGHNGAPILMTVPNLILEYGFTDSLFLREVVTYLPEVFTGYDKKETDPTFPMYRFMEIGTGYANLAFNQQLHYRYLDNESGFNPNEDSTRSGLTDPFYADSVHLPWLSQFAGLADRQTTAESLLSGYDLVDEDEIDDYIRWQIGTAFFGRKAGSLEALREAVKYVLTGTKFVTIYKNYLGNPWHIKVYTKTAETPGGVESESSDVILGILEKVKPVGYEVFHESNVDGSDRSFIIGSPTLGVLGQSRL